MKHLLVTGAAGFIGSNFVALALKQGYRITIFDALTYAGHKENFETYLKNGTCDFVEGNLCDLKKLENVFEKNKFSGVIHFAAESHVDNSIKNPKAFIDTNIIGTFNLLEVSRKYFSKLTSENNFRFLHVSTDEVFGSLGETGQFDEATAYAPNSPYSASKAASDHLVRAWFHTYKLPTITTNCSNNYGPHQFPEKLIPRMITQALKQEPLPVYGQGLNIRDWIHVEDHCAGVLLAFEKGTPGETYCFGGNSERNNLQVVNAICEILNKKSPRADGKSHTEGIRFVEDRAGHDFRYSIKDKKAQEQLGFTRKYKNLEEGLAQTVAWYLENKSWCEKVLQKEKGPK